MALIEMTGIRKHFRDGSERLNEVLRGIDLTVERGDFLAIKGASGSGKTTLLSVLGLLIRPDGGEYRLDGNRLFEDEADDARTRNQRIGFVFQDHRLLPQYTVLENILLPTLAYQATSKREQMERALGLMRSTGIEALADRYPAGLSGGESSRVALCRALIMNPALVLADEPTGQLDADNARAIAGLLAGMNREMGTTVIMVTHSDEMASYAKQVKILNKGCLE
ncbi:MAG TPA: ABC transporter ATP-binding protein [Candidatus Parabacteroides intestinipullorum]|uniref:ABC transporter ATP-binding protein n=1 Tax=Candidatus Parabacteroides intestinipullorum TaxID=2838723 RepID=A0A9D1XA50_9BACT|nr:ABC transporter ATP-binding protein [Candidatus Parabacteroides intestinipullorum]